MTVSTVVDHNDYVGNGVTTSFPYAFRIFKKTDLVVTVIDLNENLTVLTLDSDYTVTNAGSYTGGNVILPTALATGWQISIARELEATQETDLRNQGKFFAEVHEDAFDKLTMLIQQAYSVFRLALRKPSSIANWYDALNNYIRNVRDPRDPQDAATKNYVDSLASTNLGRTLRVPEQIPQLPDAATRANKMPAFDSTGNPIVVLPPSGSATDVLIQLAATHGSLLIGGVDNVFQNVADMISTAPAVGKVCRTLGYYAPNDGGGADYIISSGAPLQDYTDAGSVVIDGSKFAFLMQKDSYNFKQFGVKAADQTAASDNDSFIAMAVTRSRFGFSTINITDVIYHKKPIIFEYYHRVIGYAIGADASFTPRFIKVDNTKSGIPDLLYPGGGGSDVYDVDAGIIVKRQNSATQHARGIILKGFIVQSLNKSTYALYTPRMADFDIEVGSRGFNCGHYWRDMFLGRVGGRHIGLGDNATDFILSTAWYGTPTSFGTAGSGNSVTFYGSANSYNRGLVLEGFANAALEHMTLEQINKGANSSINPLGVSLAGGSSAYGVVSCESSITCIIRVNNSVADIKFNATYNVTQNNATDGIFRLNNAGRLNLSDSTISASSPSVIVKDDSSLMKVGRLTKLSNVGYSITNVYNFFDERISSGYITGSDSSSYPPGSVVGFSTIIGPANATLSSGIIRFTSPGVMQIVVTASGVTAGSFTFGINSVFNYSVNAGSTTSFLAAVSPGDTLNIKSASSATLSSNGGLVFYLYPSR